jgi:hypothetical protein
MKTITIMPGAVIMTALILLSMTACGDIVGSNNDNVNDNNEPTHYSGSLSISGQQVWVQNRASNRINDLTYLKYTGGDKKIYVFPAYLYGPDGNIIRSLEPAGSGVIKNGFLSFKADGLPEEKLIKADHLKKLFGEWDNVKIEPLDTMGNIIYPVTTDAELLNREGLTGTHSSISLESILFIYVNKDCRVTGSPGYEKIWDDHFSYTDSDLYFSLKKGWNTVCRKQTYSGDGYEKETIEIKNPKDFKWVIYSPQ